MVYDEQQRELRCVRRLMTHALAGKYAVDVDSTPASNEPLGIPHFHPLRIARLMKCDMLVHDRGGDAGAILPRPRGGGTGSDDILDRASNGEPENALPPRRET